jgi:hypothetical protein
MAAQQTYQELRDARRLAILRGDEGEAYRLYGLMMELLSSGQVDQDQLIASQVL